MNNVLGRPFYENFAWAYDSIIIDESVSNRCEFIKDIFTKKNIGEGSQIIDAGCGTGNYTIELSKKGYILTGIDMSKELLAVAKEKIVNESIPCEFIAGDISEIYFKRKFDGIICRGVLNDIIDDDKRDRILNNFGRLLNAEGVLVLDVRDWNGSKIRKEKEPIFEKRVKTSRGNLTFHCETKLNKDKKQLIILEKHILNGEVDKISEYNFTMRCWTMQEISNRLSKAGFVIDSYFGGYDYSIPFGKTDRIVVVACLKNNDFILEN